jgi:hypothetical protein
LRLRNGRLRRHARSIASCGRRFRLDALSVAGKRQVLVVQVEIGFEIDRARDASCRRRRLAAALALRRGACGRTGLVQGVS